MFYVPLCGYVLKVEPSLQLYHTSREGVLCAAEVTAIYRRRKEPEISEIQTVEGIKEVRLELKKRSLSEKRGHACALRQTQVDCEKSWTTE